MERHRLLGLSPAGFHHLSYVVWRPTHGGEAGPASGSSGAGGAGGRVVICVHGLTRNARDFDFLARALSEAGFLVVSADMAGRGQSDWLAAPEGYALPQYCADAAALIARLDVERVDWVGTSMGGLIGMSLAAQPKSPIGRLVINDIGPFVPKAALARIADYAGADPGFADLAEAEAYLREVHAPFDLSDAQWRHLAEHSVRPAGAAGGLRLHYDPAVIQTFGAAPFEDVDLWALWDRITQDVLVLRGADSDVLLAETAAEMAVRGPRAEVVEIAGCGHAPGLMAPRQTALVRDWLLAAD